MNFENLTSVDDVNKVYYNFQAAFVDVIDKHIPMEKRRSIITPAHYMNKELRGAIYKQKMYHNKFLQNKSDANWEVYRKQRNLVTKIKRNSIKTYFYERTQNHQHFIPPLNHFCQAKVLNQTITLSYMKTKKL